MLTRRLNALVESGLLERRRYSERPPRDEYLLTARGRDFAPGADRHAGLGQPALRAGGRDHADRRQPDRRSRPTRCWSTARPAGRSRRPTSCSRAGPAATEGTRRRLARGSGLLAAALAADARRDRERRAAGRRAAVAGRRTTPAAMSPRTRLLLHGPILPTLLRLAWPNILVMLAQASTGLIETWWVSRLGTDALAGMALVFPGFMMMQMLSAGAMGGGISSAIARALGAGRRDDADALVLHALLVNGALGARLLGAVPALRRRRSTRRSAARAARSRRRCDYSNVVFAGNVLVWLMNALASVIRGTGNMLVPSLAVCVGVVAAGAAVAAADLRLRPDPGARHRRRRASRWC